MKVAVLGGGPGGYVGAIRAAQLGAEVTLIEEKSLGGTCLNEGCIPTKVLLHSTELYSMLKNESVDLGFEMSDLRINWENVQNRKNKIVGQLVGGVRALLNSNKINYISGRGKFLSKNEIEVISSDKERMIVEFDRVIVATGSNSARLPIEGINLEGVITSTEALEFKEIPESICIVGGGVIGVEFASIYSSLGTKVTIVEALPNIVANMDYDVVECLKNQLIEADVDIYTNGRVNKIEKLEKKLKIILTINGEIKEIIADKVLMATGRKANTDGLGLDEIGVKREKGNIVVDKSMKTNIKGVYAIGDCTGGAMLAHVASAQGTIAAENIMGVYTPIDFKTIPYCIYTKPEIGAVGLTEKQAVEKGYNISVGKFPLYANGKSLISGNVNGLVKYVVDKETEEILGLHIAGPHATELVGAGAVAIRLEATIEEIITTIHAHPTVSESIHEAAHAVHGNAIHLFK